MRTDLFIRNLALAAMGGPMSYANKAEARALLAVHDKALRESIAAEIEGNEVEVGACGCPDPNPDNVHISLLETCRRTRDAAASVARGGTK